MTRIKEQHIDYNLRKELKERRDKGGKTWSKEGVTGYPGTTNERKAPRTADISITGEAASDLAPSRV